MVYASVDFSRTLRDWDGFGFNYVAAFQTHDYAERPQDYGSLEVLSEQDRERVIDAVFGDQGLQVTCGKMFIDPWGTGNGQTKPHGIPAGPDQIDCARYDFAWTTRWQRHFWREGLKRTRRRGDALSIIATLYCPPGWMTVQKQLRSRDLDPAEWPELAKYFVAYVRFMRDVEGLPVTCVSLHNEGENRCAKRWPDDGKIDLTVEEGDYDMLWPIDQAVDFVKFLRPIMDRHGLGDVRIAYGEGTLLPWATEYSEAFAADPEAMSALGMFGSHGFGDSDFCFTDAPLVPLRACKPDLHGWVTSDTFGRMNINFPIRLHRHIYLSKANAVIPWAGIQRHSQWRGGDPNPGCAILVRDDGTFELTPAYYLYKHFTRVGKAGMAVAETSVDTDSVLISAFAPNGTASPASFVVINRNVEPLALELTVTGTPAGRFAAVQTDQRTTFAPVGDGTVGSDGVMRFTVPPLSVTTMTARRSPPRRSPADTFLPGHGRIRILIGLEAPTGRANGPSRRDLRID